MTFRRISTEEAIKAIAEDEDLPEEHAEGFAQNIRNGHMIAGRDEFGALRFQLTEAGKRHVEDMLGGGE